MALHGRYPWQKARDVGAAMITFSIAVCPTGGLDLVATYHTVDGNRTHTVNIKGMVADLVRKHMGDAADALMKEAQP